MSWTNIGGSWWLLYQSPSSSTHYNRLRGKPVTKHVTVNNMSYWSLQLKEPMLKTEY